MEYKSESDVGAELLPILLTACPSYRVRFDRAGLISRDYTPLLWDFAAHAAEMLAAQRASEMTPGFTALDDYHHAATEHWLKDDPGVFFERFLKEAVERKLEPRSLAPFLPPRLKAKLDWFIDRPDDDKNPYPIDGFW